MLIDEIVVLLVAQRLNRRGVETLCAARESQRDGELTDHGFTRARRGAHKHPAIIFYCLAGLHLEIIEGKAFGGTKLVEMRRK